MSRIDELKEILIRASETTSMYYHGPNVRENISNDFWPSMKLYLQSGVLFFTGNTRHFEIIRYQIPKWNPSVDIALIKQICNGDNFIWCEANKENNEYTYTISLKHSFY